MHEIFLTTFPFSKQKITQMKKIYSLFFAAILFSSFANATDYPGNGKTDFGGPVGKGSLNITSDATNITFKMTKGTGGFNDALVIYIDVDGATSGFSSTSGFLDVSTGIRKAISGFNGGTQRATFNFSNSFKPEYALAFQPATSGGSSELVLLGNATHTTISSPSFTNSNNQNATDYTISIPASQIGITGSVKFSFLATYISNTGYRSEEAVGDAMTGFNQGWNAYTSTSSPLSYDPALPVIFSSFTGVIKGNTVQLNWSTQTEINTKNYEVQRSVNGSSYTTIATVTAANNANGAHYSFTDNTNTTAKAYYRIVSVDFDSKTTNSNAIIIRKDAKSVIDLLGNPVQSTIRLNISNSNAGTYQLVLYSADGVRLASLMYNHTGGSNVVSMPVPANAKGQCMLQVIAETEKQNFKILIQ